MSAGEQVREAADRVQVQVHALQVAGGDVLEGVEARGSGAGRAWAGGESPVAAGDTSCPKATIMNLTVRPSNLSGTVAIPGSKSHTIRGDYHRRAGRGPLGAAPAAGRRPTPRRRCASPWPWARRRAWATTGPAAASAAGRGCRTMWLMSATRARRCTSLAAVGGAGRRLHGLHRRRADPAPARRAAAGRRCAISAPRPSRPAATAARRSSCKGPLRGGKTAIECPTSQYLTALLLACPLAQGDTEIEVLLAHRAPLRRDDAGLARPAGHPYERVRLGALLGSPAGRATSAFDAADPGGLVVGDVLPVRGGDLGRGSCTLTGLDLADPQGDKAVVEMLRQMGADIAETPEGLRGPRRQPAWRRT